MTYRELDSLTDRPSKGLAYLGVKKGDRVALFMPNIPEFVISYYGVLKAGGIVTAMNPLFKEKEFAAQIDDCEAATIIFHEDLLPIVDKANIKTSLKNKVVVGEKKPGATQAI